MTTRQDIVSLAISYDGYLDGQGYDIDNHFSRDLGRGPEAWCGDFVTDIYRICGLPLPSMQDSLSTGYAYCPSAYAYGRAHNLIVNSWDAKPGDLALFDWNANGVADHTEIVTTYTGDHLQTCGGNSGLGNALHAYRGPGGVHRHNWPAPSGQGNNLILAVLDADKLVTFGKPIPPGPSKAPRFPGRVLMLKTPEMVGSDVHTWQNQMAKRNWPLTVDGVYGPESDHTCREFQRQKGMTVDGEVGPITWNASWMAPVTNA